MTFKEKLEAARRRALPAQEATTGWVEVMRLGDGSLCRCTNRHGEAELAALPEIERRHIELAVRTLRPKADAIGVRIFTDNPMLDKAVIPVAQALASAEQRGQEKAGVDWVACSERMPPWGERVLFMTTSFGMQIGAYVPNHWETEPPEQPNVDPDAWSGFGAMAVTHWQPLPDPPRASETGADRNG